MFRFFRHVKKNTFYRNSLLAVVLAALLPTVVAALGSYIVGVGEVEREVQDRQKLQINQSERRIKEQFSVMEQIVVRWSFNSAFANVINSKNIKTDYVSMNDLYNVLTLMKSSHNLIEDVLFFRNGKNEILNDNAGIIYLDNRQKEKYERLFEKETNFYYQDGLNVEFFDNNKTFSTVMICKVQDYRTVKNGLLVVGLSKAYIDDLLQYLNPDGYGLSFLVTKSGAIYSGNKGEEAKNPLIGSIVQDISNDSEISAVFIKKFDNETYSIAYGEYNESGWLFVTAIPLSKMLIPVQNTSRLLLAICLFSLLLIILVSFIMFRRIYKPIGQLAGYVSKELSYTAGNATREEDTLNIIRHNVDRLNDERVELREYIERNKTTLKNSFLLQLFQGSLYYYSENELRESLGRMGCNFNGKSCRVIYFSLYLPEQRFTGFNHGDEQLATYAMVNIVEDLVSDMAGMMAILNLHNLRAAMLWEEEESILEQQRDKVFSICQGLLEKVSGYLGLHVTIGISKPVNYVKELHDAYNDAENCIRYRDVGREDEIIFAEDILKNDEKLSGYPMKLENEIVQNIRMALCSEAQEKIPEFIEETKKNSSKEYYIRQNMLHLLGSVIHAIMQTGVDVNALFHGTNLYEQLNRLQEPQEMGVWMKDNVIGAYANHIQSFHEIRHRQIVEQVTEYINMNYMKDISLDICADSLGISAKRLSVIFYKLKGSYFLDYVTEVRFQKAKVLLIDTTENINEIAIKVGYQPQYFNKLFKKREGVTPGEYRQSYR